MQLEETKKSKELKEQPDSIESELEEQKKKLQESEGSLMKAQEWLNDLFADKIPHRLLRLELMSASNS